MPAWILWSALCICAWGICPILEKLGVLRLNPSLLLLSQSVLTTLVIGFSVIYRQKQSSFDFAEINLSTIAIVLALGIVGGVLGEYAYLKAIELSDASKVVALTSIYPIVTLLLSFVLLGEKITMSGALGLGFVIFGVGLLSSGTQLS